MDERAKARLDAILHAYDGQTDRQKGGTARENADAQVIQKRFAEVRETVIEPTMREVGEYLKSRGHGYEIVSSEKRNVGAGQADEASITFTVYPQGYIRAKMDAEHTPTLTFRAGDTPGRLRTQFVKRLVGGEAVSGAGHSYALEAVTPELVRTEMLELLEAVIGMSFRSSG